MGQLVSVIVRAHLQGLPPDSDAAREATAARTAADKPISKAALEQMVEERIRPLREQVRRLEAKVQAIAGGAADQGIQ